MPILDIFVSDLQYEHCPKNEFAGNSIRSYPEKPDRLDWIKSSIKHSPLDFEFKEPTEFDISFLYSVHSKDYVSFLQNIPDDVEEYSPIIIAPDTIKHLPSGFYGQVGYFFYDPATPVTPKTYTSAYASARTAFSLVENLNSNDLSIGLSRPPGHHALANRGGGYCYFNNVAITASELINKSKSVSILDLDFHHGNGTQEIFYNTDKVQYVSIHGDCKDNYPFYWGGSEEKGVDEGLGFNINLPVPNTISKDDYFDKVKLAIDEIKNYDPKIVLVSMGFDTYALDPVAGLNLSIKDYKQIGLEMSDFNKIGIVLEGGYHSDIGECFVNLLSGLI